MFDGIEIDGRAGGMIAQVNRRATDRTKGVTPIVELTLINWLDHGMKVASEIDQERRNGLGTCNRDPSTRYAVALNPDGLAILAGWPSVMAADQLQSTLVDLHPNKNDLELDKVLELANHNLHLISMMGKVAVR